MRATLDWDGAANAITLARDAAYNSGIYRIIKKYAFLRLLPSKYPIINNMTIKINAEH
ncbi:MAG: hypothetical protein FWH52_00860 [Synergistaceae bacterium]|nr:hypothetical protein [Synergistaceae bacterium]